MDWRTMTDEKEKYAAYLCSPEWGRLRRIVAERSRGMCERCKTNKIDAVHHLTYARKFQEKTIDLQGICRDCHDFVHGKTSVDALKSKVNGKPSACFFQDFSTLCELVYDRCGFAHKHALRQVINIEILPPRTIVLYTEDASHAERFVTATNTLFEEISGGIKWNVVFSGTESFV